MLNLAAPPLSLNLVGFAENAGFVTAAANLETAIAPSAMPPRDLRFSPGNPLHSLLAVEAPVSRPEAVRAVYEVAGAMVDNARFRAAMKADASPRDALRSVYRAMEGQGIVWGDLEGRRRHLVTDHITAKRYDCWSSSLLVLAVGHEMGWPLSLVRVPGHVFVRWQNGDSRFNMDFGVSRHDAEYMRDYRITHTSRDPGVYLENLGRNAVLGMMLMCRGNARGDAGDSVGALYDYSLCLALDPQNAEAYYNRGTTSLLLGDLWGCVEDLETSAKKDRHFTAALLNAANARLELGDGEKAAALYERARETSPTEAQACFASGMARWARGDARGAIDDFTLAIKKNRRLGEAYRQRAAARAAIGDFRGARADRRRAATFPDSRR
ncbi:MAG TPA: tetratricopeptide repeat protein [bacterium]|nr:tetratricopeptide repeat protein [bacterium]